MDFVGKRKIWFTIAALLIALTIFSLIFQGLNFGIDFTGGIKYMLKFEKDVTTSEIRAVLKEFDLESSSIQQSGDKSYMIRTKALEEEKSQEVLNTLQERLGKVDVLSDEKVHPTFGEELQNKALLALFIAAILMVIYITIRFEFSFAIATVLGLLYDIIITVGFFSVTQIEIDLTFIAIILTIIGYSINDTIVVFDRIRENLSFKRKEPLSETVNKSIMQTLTRTINTTFSTMLTLIALALFGGETTKTFAIALIVGFGVGILTTIFIASPLWYELKRKQGRKATA